MLAFFGLTSWLVWYMSCGQLSVVANDPEVSLTLEGSGFKKEYHGRTAPGFVEKLEPGTYTIRAFKHGKEIYQLEVQMRQFTNRSFEIPTSGGIKVENYNKDVTLYVDGAALDPPPRAGHTRAYSAGQHSWRAINRQGKEVASGKFFLLPETRHTIVIPPVDKEAIDKAPKNARKE